MTDLNKNNNKNDELPEYLLIGREEDDENEYDFFDGEDEEYDF